MKGFLSIVGDSINESEIRKCNEGLNSNVKLLLYKTFNKVVEFKKYLHRKSDALMFKFRSGTHGLNEQFGRHRARRG